MILYSLKSSEFCFKILVGQYTKRHLTGANRRRRKICKESRRRIIFGLSRLAPPPPTYFPSQAAADENLSAQEPNSDHLSILHPAYTTALFILYIILDIIHLVILNITKIKEKCVILYW